MRTAIITLLTLTLTALPPAGELVAQQPSLDPDAPPVFAQSDVDGISTRYAAVSLVNALIGGVSSGINLSTPGPRSAGRSGGTAVRSHAITLGLSAGGASMALGVVGLARGGDERALGAANLVVGAASTWVAYRAATRRTRVQLSPWIERGGTGPERSAVQSAASGGPVPRAGFTVRVTF